MTVLRIVKTILMTKFPQESSKYHFLEGVIVRLRYPETSLERIKIILTPYYLKGRTRKGMNR